MLFFIFYFKIYNNLDVSCIKYSHKQFLWVFQNKLPFLQLTPTEFNISEFPIQTFYSWNMLPNCLDLNVDVNFFLIFAPIDKVSQLFFCQACICAWTHTYTYTCILINTYNILDAGLFQCKKCCLNGLVYTWHSMILTHLSYTHQRLALHCGACVNWMADTHWFIVSC